MNKKPAQQYNWAQATKDVLIASMNKGQLPVLGCIGIVALIVWKMTPEKVDELAKRIFDSLEKGYFAGYALFALTVAAWYFHTRMMRKAFSVEYRRIGVEKSNLQSKAANTKFRSSDDK